MRSGKIRAAAFGAFAAIAMPTVAMADCPGNPDALGVARTVEIDTREGPGFGLAQYKAYDFLQPKEIVLTFDDGPWPNTTRAVLKALKEHCTKAIFFPIGKHALWHPELLKEVAADGHTIGSHTWSHANLRHRKMTEDKGKAEIEKGFSAIKVALATGGPAPFFRFPFLQDPPKMLGYLKERNVAVFSMDLDSFDFKARKPQTVVKRVMDKLSKQGKGIVLMHDFQKSTAGAMPALLKALKTEGYKVVHMRAKGIYQTLPEFDEKAKGEVKGSIVGTRPMSSVIQTVPSGN